MINKVFSTNGYSALWLADATLFLKVVEYSKLPSISIKAKIILFSQLELKLPSDGKTLALLQL